MISQRSTSASSVKLVDSSLQRLPSSQADGLRMDERRGHRQDWLESSQSSIGSNSSRHLPSQRPFESRAGPTASYDDMLKHLEDMVSETSKPSAASDPSLNFFEMTASLDTMIGTQPARVSQTRPSQPRASIDKMITKRKNSNQLEMSQGSLSSSGNVCPQPLLFNNRDREQALQTWMPLPIWKEKKQRNCELREKG